MCGIARKYRAVGIKRLDKKTPSQSEAPQYGCA
jgi:hypothetical protein